MEKEKMYDITEKFINDKSIRINKKIHWSEMFIKHNVVYVLNNGDSVLKLYINDDSSFLSEWYV